MLKGTAILGLKNIPPSVIPMTTGKRNPIKKDLSY